MSAEQKIEKGSLLISDPEMEGSFFDRTVILMVEHNEEGSVGFALNKDTEHFLHEVLEEIMVEDVPIYFGGPVEQNTLHFLHRRNDRIPHGIHLMENLYWGGDIEEAISSLNIGTLDKSDVLFFAGYSGWGPSQLMGELERDSWITSFASTEFVFQTTRRKMWSQSLRKKGGKFKLIANYPQDPRMN